MVRLTKDIEPTKMRAATVSEDEMEKIQTIKDIVRKGRVIRITNSEINFKNGESIPTDRETLHVHCSTNSTFFSKPPKPIFLEDKITLQMVLLPQPTNSAAIIAALEMLWPEDTERKNQICSPVQAPHELQDWFINFKADLQNGQRIREALGFWWLWNRY